MKTLISVCIPTYRRPALLEVAARSALSQTYSNVEVIIGDDSRDSKSADCAAALRREFPNRVRYVHNESQLGQNENVDQLFKLASGDRLVLLHDDDVLLSDALERLDAAWQRDTLIAFGRQQVITSDGTLLPQQTFELNETYHRSSENAGVQPSALQSALLQQVPNDGFMVRTQAAQKTGYQADASVGVYCDLDFNLRLTANDHPGHAVLLDSFTAQYRLSADSISGSSMARRHDHPHAAAVMYERVSALATPVDLEPARKVLLRRLAVTAVKGYALSGRRLNALKVYFSEFYPARQRFSLGGLYHIALILSPATERLRRYPGERATA